jgi:hypothetical protein
MFAIFNIYLLKINSTRRTNLNEKQYNHRAEAWWLNENRFLVYTIQMNVPNTIARDPHAPRGLLQVDFST